MKSWHWKSHWQFLWHWKDIEITMKNIYKGNHSDNHTEIFSFVVQGNWNHAENFSALLISLFSSFSVITLDFQCHFHCHYFIVNVDKLLHRQTHCTCTWVGLLCNLIVAYSQIYTRDPRPPIPACVMASSATGLKLGVFGFLPTVHAKTHAKQMRPQFLYAVQRFTPV